MINLKQKDLVADAVKAVMQQEEKHLSPKQKKIAKMAGDPEKIDAADLAALRAGKKPVKEENVEESSNPFSPNYKSQIPTKPGEKAGFDSKKIPTGTVYSKKHKPEPAEKETTKEDFSYFKDKLIESLFEEEVVDDLINEVLSKDASAGDWIHDFVHSDNPKFKGKSKAMRKKMALAAYYAKQRNEEVEQIEEKEKWIAGAIKHPGALHKQLDVSADKNIPAKKLAAAAEKGGTLGKRARLAMTLKKLPRHHGPRNEEVQITEGKHPESDTVPFVTDDSKPLTNAKDVAAKSLKRMKSEMMGKTGTSE